MLKDRQPRRISNEEIMMTDTLLDVEEYEIGIPKLYSDLRDFVNQHLPVPQEKPVKPSVRVYTQAEKLKLKRVNRDLEELGLPPASLPEPDPDSLINFKEEMRRVSAEKDKEHFLDVQISGEDKTARVEIQIQPDDAGILSYGTLDNPAEYRIDLGTDEVFVISKERAFAEAKDIKMPTDIMQLRVGGRVSIPESRMLNLQDTVALQELVVQLNSLPPEAVSYRSRPKFHC